MPRSSEQNEKLREATRQKIVDAAVALFARRGFHGTSVRAIADSAGVASGLLYSHFPSKDALLAALIDNAMSDVGSTFEAAMREASAEGFVHTLLASAAPLLAAHREAWLVSYALRYEPEVLSSLGVKLASSNSEIHAFLTQALAARGVPNASAEAWLLFGIVDGVMQAYVTNAEAYPIQDVIKCAAARYAAFKLDD